MTKHVDLQEILDLFEEYIMKGVQIYHLEAKSAYYKGGYESLMFLRDIIIDKYIEENNNE